MDFLPTKGIEYLVVIGYLLLLIPFWWMLTRPSRVREEREPARRPARVPATAPAMAIATAGAAGGASARPGAAGNFLRDWFRVPEGLHYHQGHTWAQLGAQLGNGPEERGVFRVGLDDFAQRLVGRPESLRLPEVGDPVDQGERGWSLEAAGRRVDVLSPVRGEVVEVNREVLEHPELLTEDPYGRGWVMKVRSARPDTNLKNLLPDRLAPAWMDDAADTLSRMMSPRLGTVLQDGGVPVSGLAREIDPEEWDRLAADLLLTSP